MRSKTTEPNPVDVIILEKDINDYRKTCKESRRSLQNLSTSRYRYKKRASVPYADGLKEISLKKEFVQNPYIFSNKYVKKAREINFASIPVFSADKFKDSRIRTLYKQKGNNYFALSNSKSKQWCAIKTSLKIRTQASDRIRTMNTFKEPKCRIPGYFSIKQMPIYRYRKQELEPYETRRPKKNASTQLSCVPVMKHIKINMINLVAIDPNVDTTIELNDSSEKDLS